MSQVEIEPRTLTCVECGTGSTGTARGWRAYVRGAYEGEDAELGVFCPDCAAREFDAD